MRHSFEHSPALARATSAVVYTGLLVRYGFYALGAFVLAVIAIAISSLWMDRIQVSTAKPSFRLTAPDLVRLPVTQRIVTGGRYGRVEMLQYGQAHNRDTDFAVAMMMPPGSADMVSALHWPSITPARLAPMVYLPAHYDLQTRFGAVRAREMRQQTDGQWKQCLTFISRFDTSAVYLSGWYCDASGTKPSTDRLACFLDKLVLDQPLRVPEADAFMRERMARQPYCSSSPVSQTMDTRARSTPPKRPR